MYRFTYLMDTSNWKGKPIYLPLQYLFLLGNKKCPKAEISKWGAPHPGKFIIIQLKCSIFVLMRIPIISILYFSFVYNKRFTFPVNFQLFLFNRYDKSGIIKMAIAISK